MGSGPAAKVGEAAGLGIEGCCWRCFGGFKDVDGPPTSTGWSGGPSVVGFTATAGDDNGAGREDNVKKVWADLAVSQKTNHKFPKDVEAGRMGLLLRSDIVCCASGLF